MPVTNNIARPIADYNIYLSPTPAAAVVSVYAGGLVS
jgi:hypothetical protein